MANETLRKSDLTSLETDSLANSSETLEDGENEKMILEDDADFKAGKSNEEIQNKCISKFQSTDFIMEKSIFDRLSDFFQAGGTPDQAMNLLCDNYHAIAQTANLLAQWLIFLGKPEDEVALTVEQHMHQLIMDNYSLTKEYKIFHQENIDWAQEATNHESWRKLSFKLAEKFPECLFARLMVNMISQSDSGFQNELKQVSVISQQIIVFSRIFCMHVKDLLEGGVTNYNLSGVNIINELTDIACYSEHTYFYSQVLLRRIEKDISSLPIKSNLQWISQKIDKVALKRKLPIVPVFLAINGCIMFPSVYHSLKAMMVKGELNPADVTVLSEAYSLTESDPPPVRFLRVPLLIDLLTSAIFCSSTSINTKHKEHYLYLLAYVASVIEEYREIDGNKTPLRININRDEVMSTKKVIEKAADICHKKSGPTADLIPDIPILFHQYLKFPIISVGLLKWIKEIVSNSIYFALNVQTLPVHFAILDEIASNHTLLHDEILSILIDVFEQPMDSLEYLEQLSKRRMILDRFVHLLSRGCVGPVISYIQNCWKKKETDSSLIRHFVTEVLDIIAPPYSIDFIQVFLPITKDSEIVGSLNVGTGELNNVREFIAYCERNSAGTVENVAIDSSE